MSEITNKEFREAYPSHFTSEPTLNHAFRLFLASSLAMELLAGCAPVSPEAPSSTPTETEAFNLLNYLLKEAKSYSEVETKEAQKLLGLKELVVVNASQTRDVVIDWEKVSQLPDVELLKEKKLAIIFIDEYTPSIKKELAKEPNLQGESNDSLLFTMPDGQMVMVFPLLGTFAVVCPPGMPKDYNGDLYNQWALLHELGHALEICRIGFEEYSSLSREEVERRANEYARDNQLDFLDGVTIIRLQEGESRLTPPEQLEVQAFFHWLGVQERLLKGKDEVPYVLSSKV